MNVIQTTVKGELVKRLIVKYWSKIWEMFLDRIYTAEFEIIREKAQDPTNVEGDFYVDVNS
ncbi:DeoR family transcriptional regulator [Xanthovirga aplysinae]|uniref:DeoR family transcriptional regulator n=1 Tax=Xanthovirga aplysinae TaxID=2529853 RepID=UPI0012BBDBA3|nr:DeoR family transcriptional regulator [Xanthovirga aplysinae]MTI29958.1 DeoR family transcriptional regulator [Xanthovirga aplysinae]